MAKEKQVGHGLSYQVVRRIAPVPSDMRWQCRLSVFVSGRPWQLFGLFLCQRRGARTLQLLTVWVDQGRSRSVAPARSILRPLTRYKGRGLRSTKRSGRGFGTVRAIARVLCIKVVHFPAAYDNPDEINSSSILACCLLFLVGASWEACATESLTIRGSLPDSLAALITLVAWATCSG
jgi:hypothetical protein